MKKAISVVLILVLNVVTGKTKADYTFGTPTNLGPIVNSSAVEGSVEISADGLSLFFDSDRTGGNGGFDIWVTTRETVDDEWNFPLNLGANVNSSANEAHPSISSDGLSLFFHSTRSGGSGLHDLWMTTRLTIHDDWGIPVNLGPKVNSSKYELLPEVSADGLVLCKN